MTTDHQGAEALKPCPFCGGTEMQIGMLGHADDCYFALHERLRKAPPADLSMLPYVHAAWNRRPAPAAGGDGLPELPEQVARVYWTLHDGPHVGWQSYKAMNAAILEGPQPERPLYTADQMRQYARDAVAAKVPQWLPIEQAPKDPPFLDKPMLVYGMRLGEIHGASDEKPSVHVVDWYDRDPKATGYHWGVADTEIYGAWVKATHFMPLPAPPSDSAAEGGGENAL